MVGVRNGRSSKIVGLRVYELVSELQTLIVEFAPRIVCFESFPDRASCVCPVCVCLLQFTEKKREKYPKISIIFGRMPPNKGKPYKYFLQYDIFHSKSDVKNCFFLTKFIRKKNCR